MFKLVLDELSCLGHINCEESVVVFSFSDWVIHSSLTDPGVVELFKLFLAILEVLNEGVLDEKITKACQNK